MIAIVEDEVFVTSARLDLLSLFHLGLMGRHRIQTDPPYRPAADTAINRWLAELDPLTRDEVIFSLDLGMERDALGIPAEVVIRIGKVQKAEWTNPPRLPLSDALPFLIRPLKILVENRLNDGAFLRTVIPSTFREAFRKALEQEWIEIEHGGGSDLKARLVTATRKDVLRSWTVFDSDAREPGQPSAACEALCQVCRSKGISHHALHRRAIENYLPAKALQAWANNSLGKLKSDRRRAAAAFAGMKPAQRYHYNMKMGFEGDRKDRQRGVPSLYDAILGHRDLQQGFGSSIASLFHEKEFPLLEEWLMRDGQHQETLSMIRSLLRRM